MKKFDIFRRKIRDVDDLLKRVKERHQIELDELHYKHQIEMNELRYQHKIQLNKLRQAQEIELIEEKNIEYIHK